MARDTTPTYRPVSGANNASLINSGTYAINSLIDNVKTATDAAVGMGEDYEEGRLNIADKAARTELERLDNLQQYGGSGKVLSKKALDESIANITQGTRLNTNQEQARLQGITDNRLDSLLKEEYTNYSANQLSNADKLRVSYDSLEQEMGVKDVNLSTGEITLESEADIKAFLKQQNPDMEEELIQATALDKMARAKQGKAALMGTDFKIDDEARRKERVVQLAQEYGVTPDKVDSIFKTVDINQNRQISEGEKLAMSRLDARLQEEISSQYKVDLQKIANLEAVNEDFNNSFKASENYDPRTALLKNAEKVDKDMGEGDREDVYNTLYGRLKNSFNDLVVQDPNLLTNVGISPGDIETDVPSYVMKKVIDQLEIQDDWIFLSDKELKQDDSQLKDMFKAALVNMKKGLDNNVTIQEAKNAASKDQLRNQENAENRLFQLRNKYMGNRGNIGSQVTSRSALNNP